MKFPPQITLGFIFMCCMRPKLGTQSNVVQWRVITRQSLFSNAFGVELMIALSLYDFMCLSERMTQAVFIRILFEVTERLYPTGAQTIINHWKQSAAKRTFRATLC